MASIPNPPFDGQPNPYDPCLALELCQRLREMLEAHFRAGAVGYSAQRDLAYRRLRQEFIELVRAAPEFEVLRDKTHILPATLADKSEDFDMTMWELSERQSVVKLQGMVLTALESSGANLPLSSGGTDTPKSDRAPFSTQNVAGRRPNRAQRRSVQRCAQARDLRDQGQTIKEIARALGCSERTVFSYLQEPQ